MVRGQPTIRVHKNEVRSYLTSGTKINSKCIKGFPGGSAGKEFPSMWETWVLSLSWEDFLEKGKATHSSILAWRNPWTV